MLSDQVDNTMEDFVDDMIVKSTKKEQHLAHLT